MRLCFNYRQRLPSWRALLSLSVCLLMIQATQGAPVSFSDSTIISAAVSTKLSYGGRPSASSCSISMAAQGVDNDILLNFSCDALPGGSGTAIAAFVVLNSAPTVAIPLRKSSMVVLQNGLITETGNALICPSSTIKPGGRLVIPKTSQYTSNQNSYTVMIGYITSIPSSAGRSTASGAGLICGAGHSDNPFCSAYGTQNLRSYLSDPAWTKNRPSNVPSRGLDVYLATVLLGPTAKKVYNQNNTAMFQKKKVRGPYKELQAREGFLDIINAFSAERSGGKINSITPKWTNVYVQDWIYGNVVQKKIDDSDEPVKIVTDAQIRSALKTMASQNEFIYEVKLNEGNFKSIFTQGDVHVVAIHLEPGFYVTVPGGVGTTCLDICAYHSTTEINFQGDTKKLHYTVIPHPNKKTCNACRAGGTVVATKVMASHEFSEILTKAALGNNYIPNAGAEIADLCSWEDFESGNQEKNSEVTLQQLWDVRSRKCSNYY